MVLALLTGLAVLLSNRYWLPFAIAAFVGSVCGMSSGLILFPSSDGIAKSYLPLEFFVGTVVAALVALISGLCGRLMSIFIKRPGPIAWVVFMCCVASGPVAFVLTPPLVAHRVARNDRIAEQRFTSLKAAVEQTLTADGNRSDICDGRRLMKHYAGPPFSNEDWDRITGNYVTQDGYVFMVYCREKGGYTIHAQPSRGKADGTLSFCTDESRRIGCGMNGTGSRYACVPCSK